MDKANKVNKVINQQDKLEGQSGQADKSSGDRHIIRFNKPNKKVNDADENNELDQSNKDRHVIRFNKPNKKVNAVDKTNEPNQNKANDTESVDGRIEKRVKKIHRFISKMPSLSTTVSKVLEICNNPGSSPNDLNRVITLDPVLTGKVLKLINSAYYAQLEKVTNLTRAIIRLGLNTIKNLVLSSAVIDSIGSTDSKSSFSMDEFWAHSICVGVTARYLAKIKLVPVIQREDYFVAGLLHDLGKIPLNGCFPADYETVLKAGKENKKGIMLEKVYLGLNHCQVGGLIAEKWKLSDEIKDSLCHHHNPSQATKSLLLVVIIYIADFYSKHFGIKTMDEIFFKDAMETKLLNKIGIKIESLTELEQTVAQDIESAKVFLNLTKK